MRELPGRCNLAPVLDRTDSTGQGPDGPARSGHGHRGCVRISTRSVRASPPARPRCRRRLCSHRSVHRLRSLADQRALQTCSPRSSASTSSRRSMTRPTRPMLTVHLGVVAALTRQLAAACCARPGTREIGVQAAIAALTFCQLPLGSLRHQLAVHGRAAVHLITIPSALSPSGPIDASALSPAVCIFREVCPRPRARRRSAHELLPWRLCSPNWTFVLLVALSLKPPVCCADSLA